jgi:hypothetical protein
MVTSEDSTSEASAIPSMGCAASIPVRPYDGSFAGQNVRGKGFQKIVPVKAGLIEHSLPEGPEGTRRPPSTLESPVPFGSVDVSNLTAAFCCHITSTCYQAYSQSMEILLIKLHAFCLLRLGVAWRLSGMIVPGFKGVIFACG